MRPLVRTGAALTFMAAAVLAETLIWPAFALPSILSLIVVADLLALQTSVPLLRREERRILLVCTAVIGVMLYATTLGIVPGDLYRAGFSPFTPIVVAIAAATAARSYPRLAVSVLIVLVAFDLRLLPSENLFDYLVDPFLTLGSLAWCATRAWSSRPSSEGSGGS
jgi:hypothetical protein